MNKNQSDQPEDLEAQVGNELPEWCYIQEERMINDFSEIPGSVFFKMGVHFDLFYEHYKDCMMMLELKKGKCPNWVIKYIAAFELTKNDQDTPRWIKEMIFPSYLSTIDTVSSPQRSSETDD
jgi:hypothetical protein